MIKLPQPSPRRPNGHGRTLGAEDGLTPDQVEGLAAFAETSAAAVLGGQSTGRVSARMAAREERLKRREELMKQGGGDGLGAAEGKIKTGVKTKLASLAQRKLSPLELALQPTAEDFMGPHEKEDPTDVPVLPEYMVTKIKELGPAAKSQKEKVAGITYKNGKEGLLNMRISGQAMAKLYLFTLRGPRLTWRTPSTGRVRNSGGAIKGRLIVNEMAEKVTRDEGSAEVVIHCGGAQCIHLHAVNEEQAVHWHKVLKRAAFAAPPTRRSGKQLWAFLRPRLKMVVAMQEQWGTIHQLYGKTSSLFEDTALPYGIRDPDSNFSGLWDICQLFLLLYVSFTVPFRTCFGMEPELWSFPFFFDMFVDIYFLVDLVMNFRTAFFDHSGIRVVDTRLITRNYLTGWFAIDFCSCLPVGYIGLGQEESEGGGSGFKAAKVLRLFRLGKMLRLAKVLKIMRKYEETINIAPFLGVIFTLACILFAAHLLACFYYLVGTGDQILPGCAADDPDLLHPEAYNPDVCVNGTDGVVGTPLLGWVYMQDWSSQVSTGTRYVTAMYLVFNAVENGTTDAEKSYALLAELVVGLIFGALAATITNGVLGASAGEQEFTVRMSALTAWMKEKDLPKNAQARIRAYFMHKFKNKIYFNENEMMAELPPSMANSIAEHMYGDILRKMPLFRGLGESVLNKIAGIVIHSTCMKGQIIFEQGQIGTEMYCLMSGEVVVEQDGDQLGFLPEGSFFGESALIDTGEGSEIRTRTIKAMTECELCFVRREDLNALRKEYPELMVKLRRFARMGERVRPPKHDSEGNPRLIHMMQELTDQVVSLHDRMDWLESGERPPKGTRRPRPRAEPRAEDEGGSASSNAMLDSLDMMDEVVEAAMERNMHREPGQTAGTDRPVDRSIDADRPPSPTLAQIRSERSSNPLVARSSRSVEGQERALIRRAGAPQAQFQDGALPGRSTSRTKRP